MNTSGSGTIDDIYFFNVFSGINTNQTATRVTALRPRIQTMGTGAIGTAIGLSLAGWAGSNFTNSYGIYMDTSIDRGTANRYALYSSSTSNSYMAGKLGIGTPNPQAILDVSSTTSGFLPPRMNKKQRSFVIPVEGMVIYNTGEHKLNVYTGSAWETVTSQ
ncbi:MAG TPA: hypothetical protein VGO63_00205 [Candidatus Paceibacterota bacterium]|nr:hypothetical protein [Candidatus Paceibacterota bacterium]